MAGRNTVQRGVILETLNSLANHPTADEVYDALHDEYPSISKATVYRTLNRLSDEGEVLRVKINNGADHFDHNVFEHYHVRCTGCGKVDDVLIPILKNVNAEAGESSGYAISAHTLQFDGLCPACQAKGNANKQ
jgi:Fe2+ or Zn2+ uptake regulation protein